MSSRQLRGTDSRAPDQSWSDCTRCSSPRDIYLFGTIPSESSRFGFTWDHPWIPLHPLQAVPQQPPDTRHFPFTSYYWSLLPTTLLVVRAHVSCWRFSHRAFTLLLPAYYFDACRWYLFVRTNITLTRRRTKQGTALQIAYLILFWLEMHFPSRNDWLAGLWPSCPCPCHMHCAGHVNWFVTILAHWLRRPISTSFRSFHNMIIYWTLTMTKKTTTQMFWHHMPTKRTYISRVCSVHLPPEARNF